MSNSNFFKYECPHCGQRIDVPYELSGEIVNCPACNGEIVPNNDNYSSEKNITLPIKTSPCEIMPESKNCPFCAETIKFEAKKCKHCGEILDATLRKQQRSNLAPKTKPQLQQPPPPPQVIVQPRGEGCFLQTMNAGCMIIFAVIVLIIILGLFAANS